MKILQAMAQLAVKLNWDYTTVAYGSDPVSHELKALLEDELKANLICVDEYFEFSDTSAAGDIASRISNDAKPKAVIVIGLKNGGELNTILFRVDNKNYIFHVFQQK